MNRSASGIDRWPLRRLRGRHAAGEAATYAVAPRRGQRIGRSGRVPRWSFYHLVRRFRGQARPSSGVRHGPVACSVQAGRFKPGVKRQCCAICPAAASRSPGSDPSRRTTRLLRARIGRSSVDHPELQPNGAGAELDGLVHHRTSLVRRAEDVDHSRADRPASNEAGDDGSVRAGSAPPEPGIDGRQPGSPGQAGSASPHREGRSGAIGCADSMAILPRLPRRMSVDLAVGLARLVPLTGSPNADEA